ncbi:unnamed protein product, partial [Phaeothamnion confervicola]
MKQLLRIFFRTEGTRPWLVLACLLLAGLAEAGSIGTLLPAASSVLESGTNGKAGAGLAIKSFIESFGISASLGNLLIIVVFLMVLKSVLAFAALSYSGITSARVAINLRRKLIKAIFDARWSFYAGQSGGRFANAISNDATRASDAYQYAATVAAGIIQLLAYASVAFFIDWRIALLGGVAGAILYFAMNSLLRLSRRTGYKQTDRVSNLTVDMIDM